MQHQAHEIPGHELSLRVDQHQVGAARAQRLRLARANHQFADHSHPADAVVHRRPVDLHRRKSIAADPGQRDRGGQLVVDHQVAGKTLRTRRRFTNPRIGGFDTGRSRTRTEPGQEKKYCGRGAQRPAAADAISVR